MWAVIVPLVVVVGAVPFLIRRRLRQLDDESGAYVPVADAVDLEMADGSDEEPIEAPEPAIVLETMVCDVVEWLNEARERLDIIDGPLLERVDAGGSAKATRITFELKGGRREIWLDGPDFMQPLPRIRDPEWKSADGGIEFVRSAAGVEKAVFESCVKRE
jgi:hypothetical protein